MIETLLLILVAIGVAVVLYYTLKKATVLIINAVVGLVTLYLLNVFNILSLAGAPDIEINLATILICAFGGLPGAVLLVVLHLVGFTI
ncbi:MAG: pro-sigmaK processing inhibitor BofA family protein [Methanomicrobiaceae archaeon]|nr:pro-sigmaK processing inhibitor BofA family protein [Methanomicrobiaceae archaeon]